MTDGYNPINSRVITNTAMATYWLLAAAIVFAPDVEQTTFNVLIKPLGALLAAVCIYLSLRKERERVSVEASRDRLEERRVANECRCLHREAGVAAQRPDSIAKQSQQSAAVDQSISSLRSGSFQTLTTGDE